MFPMSKTRTFPVRKTPSEHFPMIKKSASLLILFSILLLTSCTGPLTDASFVPDGTPATGGIVYSFASVPEKNFFLKEMHPEGSSAPCGKFFRETVCAVSWTRPDSSRVHALWNSNGKEIRVPLRSSGNIYSCFDSEGKRTRLELIGNKMYISLSGRVLYIHGSENLSLEIPSEGR